MELTPALHIGLAKILGYGNPTREIIGNAILALVAFFYIYTVGSFLRINIFILHNRLSYNTYFDFYIIARNIDHVIIIMGLILWSLVSLKGNSRIIIAVGYGIVILLAGVSGLAILLDVAAIMAIPIVICSLIYNKLTSKKFLDASPSLFVNYIATIVTVLSIIGILISSGTLFSVPINQTTSIPNHMYEIFLLLSSISPILVLLLISCLPVKLMKDEIMLTAGRIKKFSLSPAALSDNDSVMPRTRVVWLLVMVLLSIALALIPHNAVVNIDKEFVGVDTPYYIDWVTALIRSSSLQEFLHQAFIEQSAGDRPITLIVLFAISKIVPISLVDAIEYVPLLLGPLLVVVVYLLTRELTSDEMTSLFAGFLTAVSFQTLIGIYAGFYSNWLALIIGYLSFVFLLRFLKKSDTTNLAVYSALMVLLIFTHIYTWSIFLIVTSVFLTVVLKLNNYAKRNIIVLLLVLSASILIDIVKFSFTGSSSGIAQDIIIAGRGGLGLEQFALRWNNLIEIVQTWYGVQFSNFIILMLGLYWIWISKFRKVVNILIVIFLSFGFLISFLGIPAVQGRILYNIPFQIAAAISLAHIKKHTGNSVITLACCLWLVNISLRAVINFHF